MHYYSFNIGDYRKDTVHLKPIEHYIYRTLIDMYYLDEKPIPNKTQWVMRRLNLETDEEKKALENVLSDFFHETADGFKHDRIEKEVEKYHANVEKNRENGKKGGRPPKNKPKKTQSVSDGLPDESKENPNQKPRTNNQEPETSNEEPQKNGALANSDYAVGDSIRDWVPPTLEQINARLVMSAPPMPAITKNQYVEYGRKFKNYFVEQELDGKYLRTEGRRIDKLVDWIKREVKSYSKNRGPQKIDTPAPLGAPKIDINKRFAHLKQEANA